MGPSFLGDLIVLSQPPVRGGFLFCLLQVARLGDAVNGRIGEDDGQNTVAASFQQGGEFPDVVFLLGEEEEDQKFGEGFFQVVFQAVGFAFSLVEIFLFQWSSRLFDGMGKQVLSLLYHGEDTSAIIF